MRDPFFLVDPSRTEIISHARVESAPIRVLRNDGEAVTGDLYALRFYIWNAGKRSIKRVDVLDTIKLAFDDSAEILDFKILNRSRQITGSELYPERVGRRLRALTVSFLILERDDGFTGQITYQGSGDAHLRISGTIEGAPGGFRDASTPSWMMVIRSSPVVAALQFFYVLAIAFLAGNARGARRTRGEYARGVVPPEVEASLRAHLSRRRRQIAVLVAVVTWIGAGATVLEARVSGRQRARSNVVQSVPHSLLP